MRAKIRKLTVFNCLPPLSFKLYRNPNKGITSLNETSYALLRHQFKVLTINRLNCINKYEIH